MLNEPTTLYTLESLLSLPAGEHSWIEFKAIKNVDLTENNASQKFVAGLANELCAFANTGAGKLVVGIEENKATGERSISCGGVPLARGRERMQKWFQDVIPDLLDQNLTTFDVYEVTGDLCEKGKGVFVIEVRLSPSAPHQVRGTGAYYGRVADKARPLPHQLVLDILNRESYPKLEVAFRYNDRSKPQTLKVFVLNKGRVAARLVNIQISIFPADRPFPQGDIKYAIYGEKYWRMYEYDLPHVLPQRNREISIEFINEGYEGISVKWNISCDNSPVIEGETALTDEHLMKTFDRRGRLVRITDSQGAIR